MVARKGNLVTCLRKLREVPIDLHERYRRDKDRMKKGVLSLNLHFASEPITHELLVKKKAEPTGIND
jgi:hypothetical protein